MTDEEFDKHWLYVRPERMHDGALEAVAAYQQVHQGKRKDQKIEARHAIPAILDSLKMILNLQRGVTLSREELEDNSGSFAFTLQYSTNDPRIVSCDG